MTTVQLPDLSSLLSTSLLDASGDAASSAVFLADPTLPCLLLLCQRSTCQCFSTSHLDRHLAVEQILVPTPELSSGHADLEL